MRRKTISRKTSKRVFSRTASKVNRRNLPRPIMRGGIRL